MKTMMVIFHEYASKDEGQNKLTLSKNELKQLLSKELKTFMKAPTDAEGLKEIMEAMDHDGDKEVDFKEFIIMVSSITIMCNEYLVSCLQKKGK